MWLSRVVAANGGVHPGGRVAFVRPDSAPPGAGRSTLRVGAIYRPLDSELANPYWVNFIARIRSVHPDSPIPPTFALIPLSQLYRLADRVGGGSIANVYEFPLDTRGMTAVRARRTARAFQHVAQALTTGSALAKRLGCADADRPCRVSSELTDAVIVATATNSSLRPVVDLLAGFCVLIALGAALVAGVFIGRRRAAEARLSLAGRRGASRVPGALGDRGIPAGPGRFRCRSCSHRRARPRLYTARLDRCKRLQTSCRAGRVVDHRDRAGRGARHDSRARPDECASRSPTQDRSPALGGRCHRSGVGVVARSGLRRRPRQRQRCRLASAPRRARAARARGRAAGRTHRSSAALGRSTSRSSHCCRGLAGAPTGCRSARARRRTVRGDRRRHRLARFRRDPAGVARGEQHGEGIRRKRLGRPGPDRRSSASSQDLPISDHEGHGSLRRRHHRLRPSFELLAVDPSSLTRVVAPTRRQESARVSAHSPTPTRGFRQSRWGSIPGPQTVTIGGDRTRVQVVARVRAFPGMQPSQPLLVVPARALAVPSTALTYVWATGPSRQVRAALSGSSLSPSYLTDGRRLLTQSGRPEHHPHLRLPADRRAGDLWAGPDRADALSEQPPTIATRHVRVSPPDGCDANGPGMVGRPRIDGPRGSGHGRRARRSTRHSQRDRPSRRPARTVRPGSRHDRAVGALGCNRSRRGSRLRLRRRWSRPRPATVGRRGGAPCQLRASPCSIGSRSTTPQRRAPSKRSLQSTRASRPGGSPRSSGSQAAASRHCFGCSPGTTPPRPAPSSSRGGTSLRSQVGS